MGTMYTKFATSVGQVVIGTALGLAYVSVMEKVTREYREYKREKLRKEAEAARQ